MSTSSRKFSYALLVGFGLFMACGAALLWVDNRRIERHTDELNDLRIHLNGRDQDVEMLRRKLRACCPDSALSVRPVKRAAASKPSLTDGWDH